MELITTAYKGLVIIKPDTFEDQRGYFFESYNQKKFAELGIDFKPVQDNESSSSRNVIRGLHYQTKPMAQAKLIRVIKGKIFDVAVDLRKDSATFGKWFGIELDSSVKLQLFIPRGFAHGFSVLSEKAIILYKCDNLYSPDHERGIIYNDPLLNIDWKIKEELEIVSKKDRSNPGFSNAEINF
jgi:dTDP-4-dehydrorhamnose 3,5-epimerase